MYKIEVYLPPEALELVKKAIQDYCRVSSDRYTHCMSWYRVHSMWMPVGEADPYLGTVGEDQYADEYVLVCRCRDEDLETVVNLVRKNHPYEEPAIDVVRLAD